MNQEILNDYFRDPYNTSNTSVNCTNTWCKGETSTFVVNNINITNYKFFDNVFNDDTNVMIRFRCKDWLTNDIGIYNIINVDLLKKTEKSKKNIKIIAMFCRMYYFTEFSKNNNEVDIITMFNVVFGNNEKLYHSKKKRDI